MDNSNSIDLASFFLILSGVLFVGILTYIFGFKKTTEPRLLEDNDEKSKENKKKQKNKDSKVASSAKISKKEESTSVQPVVAVKEEKVVAKPSKVEVKKVETNKKQQNLKKVEETNNKKKNQKISNVVNEELEEKTVVQQPEESSSEQWITVHDKKQKKTQKQTPVVVNAESAVKEATIVKQEATPSSPQPQRQTKEKSPVLQKKAEISSPKQSKKQNEEKKSVIVNNSPVETPKPQTTAANVAIAPTISSVIEKIIDTETLIREAVESDDWIPANKNSKKNSKTAKQSSITPAAVEVAANTAPIKELKPENDSKTQKKSKNASTKLDKTAELFKQTALDESIIIIDPVLPSSTISNNIKSTDSNQSSSDSVQEVDDWLNVKSKKSKKVRREQ